ncbi:hypothetical protein HanIR_Chr11g0549921 [Helianthus annuus]|nr:hypothetical protein HanIR_Chr11g0549921 [Helianthus annuus]
MWPPGDMGVTALVINLYRPRSIPATLLATTTVVAKSEGSIPATEVFTGDNRSIASEQYRRRFTGDMSPLKVNSGDKRGLYRRRLSPLKVPCSCSEKR